ncbi:hypothetical protein HYH03_016134 [Edaphochlamys debaryana]|uniref:GDSL esterase/lipase n=1 Tax=Edaphochlamys debaryana TaxID=47281 RepID=A0A835XJB5_9CHLO|nr:hypothetical protein HYH03_016134 [Edaphochlamys debaryana]|eukprot:KAG2485148.1 hypothetical protein HYH03_016134 [Edaphochlamys debaryana]
MCVAVAPAQAKRELRDAEPSGPRPDFVYLIVGDSLSDTGRCFAAGGVPDSRLYYDGRFSNGPVWVDVLKANLSAPQGRQGGRKRVQFLNYAFGAATACPVPGHIARYPFVQHLQAQTAAAVADLAAGRVLRGRGTRVVAVQWVGANDLQLALEAGSLTDPQAVAAAAAAVAGCRLAAVQALLAAGVRDVVLGPLPPLHLAPIVPGPLKEKVAAMVRGFNAALAAGVGALQAGLDGAGAGARVALLGDADNAWVEGDRAGAARDGLVLDEPCVATDAMELRAPTLRPPVCPDPSKHIFYDPRHPGAAYHAWFALEGLLPRLRALGLAPPAPPCPGDD